MASGGSVGVSRGTFDIAASLYLGSYQTLRGQNRNATIFKLAASANCDVITNTGTAEKWNACILDLKIDGNKANNTAGHGIKLTGARQHVLDRLYVTSCANAGIELIGTASYLTGSTNLNNIVLASNDEEGIYIGAYAYGCNLTSLVASANATNIKIISGGEHRVSNCNLMQSTTLSLQVYSAFNVLISNVYTSDDTTDAFQVNRSSDVYLVNCFAEDTATNCFYIVGASGAVSDNVHLLNCGVTTTSVTPTRGLYLYGVSSAASVITDFSAIGCDFSSATTAVSKSPSTVLGGINNIHSNRGYLAPGEVTTYSGSIATLTQNAYNSLDNPFGQDVLVLDTTWYYTTATSNAATLDSGIGSSATTDYTTLLANAPLNTTAPVAYHSVHTATYGQQTTPILWKSGSGNRYLNMSIKDAAATSLVCGYTVRVMGV